MSQEKLTPEERKPLPFEPETLPEARARYQEALEKVYNVGRINAGLDEGPGLKRENVFDFKSGLRLIISLEYAPLNKPGKRGPYEHVVGRYVHFGAADEDLTPFDEFIRTYYYISGWTREKGRPVQQHFTEAGNMHVLFERPDLRDRALDQLSLNSPKA